MPLSNRIIRGDAAKSLPSWDFNAVGPKASNPVDRLYNELGTRQPVQEQVVLSDEELRLKEWEAALAQREQALVQLEQETLEQALQTGTQRGYEAGWDSAHHERVALVQAAQSIQDEFAAFKGSLSEKILDLAVLVARKVVGDTVRLNDEASANALREVLGSMDLSGKSVSLLAHPQTLQVLQAQMGDQGELAGIRLKSDPSQLQGGFVLQHPEGAVNASMESRWERAIETLGRQTAIRAEDFEATEEITTQPEAVAEDEIVNERAEEGAELASHDELTDETAELTGKQAAKPSTEINPKSENKSLDIDSQTEDGEYTGPEIDDDNNDE